MSKVKGKSSSVNIDHLSKLANLTLSNSERKILEKQLEETLDYVQKLEEVDVRSTVPTSQVTDLENVTRDDIAQPSLTQENALKNAKSTYNGFIMTEAILEGQ